MVFHTGAKLINPTDQWWIHVAPVRFMSRSFLDSTLKIEKVARFRPPPEIRQKYKMLTLPIVPAQSTSATDAISLMSNWQVQVGHARKSRYHENSAVGHLVVHIKEIQIGKDSRPSTSSCYVKCDNLVLHDSGRVVTWASHSTRSFSGANSKAVLQDDGNFVLNFVLWWKRGCNLDHWYQMRV